MLRSRAKKVTLKTVKQLDAFTKVPDSYVETSPVVSVVTCFLILWLMYAEISYYLDSRFIFKFLPDTDFDAKLKINVDLTVAMPCGSIGADILDSTDQNVLQFGRLEQEDTWFELCPEQKLHFDGVRHVNSYLREEFHAIQELLWKTGQNTLFGELPKRYTCFSISGDPDACRVFGSLTLNKVAGNFHITAGRSLALPRGHIHISAFVSEREYNFSHRIDRFSFGDPSPGIVHPLEVPTEVNTFLQTLTTYQYSVKDHQRPINHHKGSHGVPGIFFKYDMSALKVRVTQQRDSLGQFLVHLSATVSGIYITSGIINSLVQILVNVFTCKYLDSKERSVAYSKKPRPPISLVKPDIIPDIAVMTTLPDISPT
ncbi:unnamed protein product [Timema podura]|uniref:Endoplasmic reticulum-Golgi intermediate compartment protein 2 n=1 Tax=Timema podura TaxID=61482 RepID=A0ABN7NHJ6_TIMPD|nr:unnamed protein product [Timema podura]